MFTPGELLERLATLVPRPRIDLLLYHGVLAPNAPWRRAIVPAPTGEEDGAPPGNPRDSAANGLEPVSAVPTPWRRERPKYRAWADSMWHAFEADVLACAQCDGQMVLIATIEDPGVITRILTHLGLSLDRGAPDPARPPPDSDGGEGA